MSKLLQRLRDASRSGVYRAARKDAIVDVLRGSGVRLAQVALRDGAGKDEILAQIARELSFPDWFGGNWDALEDCLGDLSWSDAAGHVLVIEGAQVAAADDIGVLRDILASTAAYWSGRGRPFFAVFIGPDPGLPELHRERQ